MIGRPKETHCHRGHEKIPENRSKNGAACLLCRKEQKKEKIRKGICFRCKSPVLEGSLYCASHREIQINDSKRRRADRIKNKQCLYCGNPTFRGLRHCEDHHDYVSTVDKVQARSVEGKFRNMKSHAKRRALEVTLTFSEFKVLSELKECHYCGLLAFSETGHSLDRKDNQNGYHISNVVKCCDDCNTIRGSLLTYDEMLLLGPVIRQIKLSRIGLGDKTLRSISIQNRRPKPVKEPETILRQTQRIKALREAIAAEDESSS